MNDCMKRGFGNLLKMNDIRKLNFSQMKMFTTGPDMEVKSFGFMINILSKYPCLSKSDCLDNGEVSFSFRLVNDL